MNFQEALNLIFFKKDVIIEYISESGKCIKSSGICTSYYIPKNRFNFKDQDGNVRKIKNISLISINNKEIIF